MSLIQGFTRRETLALTEITSNRLQYLERAGLIIPERVGGSVLYTWEQLLEIRAIKNLRKEVSLQTIRKIIEFLNRHGIDDSLRDKQLVVLDDEVFWVRNDWKDFSEQMPSVLKVASKKKGVGQYVLLVIPSLGNIVKEIWEAAQESDYVDFESFRQRAKVSAA